MFSFFFVVAIVAAQSTNPYRRVLVIPDIHGDAEALLLSIYAGYRDTVPEHFRVSLEEFKLRFESVITNVLPPPAPLYLGNDIALVQMGDLIDRGDQSLKCLLIMKAARMVTGFKVFQVLGNHELAAAAARPNYYSGSINPHDDLNRDSESIVLWDHIIWSREFQPMVKIGDTLFVHAGITLDQLEEDNFIDAAIVLEKDTDYVQAYNDMILDDLIDQDDARDVEREYLSSDTFFTMRVYEEADIDCEQVVRALDIFGATRIVVGHMATRTNRVRQNCDGRIILSDFMASRFMNIRDRASKPGVLVLEYLEGRIEPSLFALYYEPTSSFVDTAPFLEIAPLGIRNRQVIVSSVSAGTVVPSGIHSHLVLVTCGAADEIRRNGVIIRPVEIDEESGILIEFENGRTDNRPNLRPIEDAIFHLIQSGKDSILPQVFDVMTYRVLDVDISAEDETVLLGPALFVKTPANLIMNRSIYYSDLSIHMQYVLDLLHTAGHCLGFVQSGKGVQYLTDRLLEKFGFDYNDSQMELIDFSQITECTRHDIQTEKAAFQGIVQFLASIEGPSDEEMSLDESATEAA